MKPVFVGVQPAVTILRFLFWKLAARLRKCQVLGVFWDYPFEGLKLGQLSRRSLLKPLSVCGV